jgi:glycosyltransferase involved in cell wall biosynthesis
MEGKKKICLVSLFAYGIFNPAAVLKFGGSETQMYFLAKELARNKSFELSFVVLDVGQKPVELYDGVKVLKAYQRGKGIVKMIFGFFKMMMTLRKADPDIIICRAFGREVGVSAVYAKFFGKKLVYCFANDQDASGAFFGGLNGKIFKFGFTNVDYYIAQSDFQAEEFKKIFPAKSGQISVIKNSWPDESPFIISKESTLWVGSSAGLKRPEIFLNLAEDFPQEEFVMVMTRSKMDEEKWEEIAAKSEKIDNLKLIESVPFKDIDSFFARAKVLVSTSSSEGFPNVFLQAARAKTPVLSLKIDPDGFIEKYDGGIVCGDDYERLKEGLNSLLTQKEISNKKGENLYQYFKAEHDLAKNIQKWEKTLNAL